MPKQYPRKVYSYESGPYRASVYRSGARYTGDLEYVVRFYQSGARRSEEDYFTEDKQDAIETAQAWLASRVKSH